MRFLPALLIFAAACGHAPRAPAPGSPRAAPDGGVAGPAVDPALAAAEISAEAHALLKSEGDLLWKRWTTGGGPMPASALAEHPRLFKRESLELVTAAARAHPESRPLALLRQQLATLLVSREAGAEIDALDRARAQLSFATDSEGPDQQERSERDLDRLLTDEPSAHKRAALALLEARAARPLAPLALARDAAVEKAIALLNLGSWSALVERAHGLPAGELAALAERTLAATEEVAAQAVARVSVRNIGVTSDRLRRADLARLVRSALADPQFPAGRAWPSATAVFKALGLEARLLVDAEPSPSKGARPLALLVDPPADVRLSLRPAGGFEEQRATLHEGARAEGGALTAAQPWELSQLGDASAAEGAAQLFEELPGDPDWLRATTELRGEPLDDLVHAQAVRRLLAARRAAALVLFEIRRREGARTAEAQAALYRGLVQRATFAVMSDDDAGRWALESDAFLRAAPLLEGAVLAAQLETLGRPGAGSSIAGAGSSSVAGAGSSAAGAAAPGAGSSTAAGSSLTAGAGFSLTAGAGAQATGSAGVPATPWWKSPASGAALKNLWAAGRSLTAPEAARALGLAALDPAALASVAAARLAYTAPEAPPPTPKPDYKYMQGDKKRRRRHKKK